MSQVRHVLFHCDCSNVRLAQDVGNENLLLSYFDQGPEEIYFTNLA